MRSTAHGRFRAPGHRDPRETELHRAVHRFFAPFLEQLQAEDRTIPSFAKQELKRFLACGILKNGFARLHCDACNTDHRIAFSCKSRWICPSCTGRRMADTGAHWVDRVNPEVVGRRNHFGSKSRRGTEAAAILYSLIETAKLRGVDPAAYLAEACLRAQRTPGAVLLPGDLQSG